MNKLAAVLAGVWLGLQLGIGYVAVPVLFQHMGKMEAGAMAGSMFDFMCNACCCKKAQSFKHLKHLVRN